MDSAKPLASPSATNPSSVKAKDAVCGPVVVLWRFISSPSNKVSDVDALPEPPDTGAPGTLNYWEYSVSAFNVAGETGKVPVGGFLGGSEAFCDPGVGPPPELEG